MVNIFHRQIRFTLVKTLQFRFGAPRRTNGMKANQARSFHNISFLFPLQASRRGIKPGLPSGRDMRIRRKPNFLTDAACKVQNQVPRALIAI